MTKALRLGRLFGADGRTLVVAMDRPRALLTKSLSAPHLTVRQCRETHVDAVIVPLGTLRTVAEHLGGLGTIFSVREGISTSAVVDVALQWGVDAIKYEAFPCGPAEQETMPVLEALGRACDAAGIPLMAEVVPHSFDATDQHTADAVSAAARMAMECGADVVKVPLPTDGDLTAVVENAVVPVVVLGGPVTDRASFLQRVRSVVGAGAAGLAVGRNMFEAPDPRQMAADLCAIIHPRTRRTNSPSTP